MSAPREEIVIRKNQDGFIDLRVLVGEGNGESPETVTLTGDALTGATTLNVKPLDYALSSGDKLLFDKNTVVTLSAAADAGVVALAVTALGGPLGQGKDGYKIRDLTGFEIAMEILEEKGDATALISINGADVTILTQSGVDRGRAQLAFQAIDTSALVNESRLYGAIWRTNSGSARPIKEVDIRIDEAGFLT